jgi:flagellum-specific ATP synthase
MHAKAAIDLRQLMAAYRDNEDLISIGAYKTGSNAVVDRAIAMRTGMEQFLAQETHTQVPFEMMMEHLLRAGQAAGLSPSATTAATTASARTT